MRIVSFSADLSPPGAMPAFQGVKQRLQQAANEEYWRSLRLADALYGEPKYRVHGQRFSAKDVAAYVQESWDAMGGWAWLAAVFGGGVKAGDLFERFGDRAALTLDLVNMKKGGLIDVQYSYSDVAPLLGRGHGYSIEPEKQVMITPKGRQWLAMAPQDAADV